IIRRVVLLGPVHRVPVRGLALPGADVFATPLGQIEIDKDAVAAIKSLPQVLESPAAHAQEHSLEVQLPFLQLALDNFKLLPLAVGDATPAEVAQVLNMLWGGDETLILISSDLSHFLPYATAKTVDRDTVQAMLNLQTTLNHQQACGATPVNGLLLAARRHHLQPRLLGLCNSGDTAGDKGRVVGYAALAFTPGESHGADTTVPGARSAERSAQVKGGARRAGDTQQNALPPWLQDKYGQLLLQVARAAISNTLGQSMALPDLGGQTADVLHAHGASFVTLKQQGELRGCIGSLQAHRPLLADIQANAIAAALHDPRFAPLTLLELDVTTVEVSVISAMQPLPFESESHALAQLRPGVDGVVFEFGRYRSTFLPQVWEQLPDAAEFMAHLKQKAGLDPNFWAAEVRLQRYTVSKFKEVGGTS
ncbi:MAG: hypothetical protein RL300_736, partial [Pseudomonadota bacterium]